VPVELVLGVVFVDDDTLIWLLISLVFF